MNPSTSPDSLPQAMRNAIEKAVLKMRETCTSFDEDVAIVSELLSSAMPVDKGAEPAFRTTRVSDGIGSYITYQPQHSWTDGKFDGWSDIGLTTKSRRVARSRIELYSSVNPQDKVRCLEIQSTASLCDLSVPAPLPSPSAPAAAWAKEDLHKAATAIVHDIETLTRCWIEKDEEEKAIAIVEQSILKHHANPSKE